MKTYSGVPSYEDVLTASGSVAQGILQLYSKQFLAENESTLKKFYWPKWSKDPLNEWSRIWEYQYVYERIRFGSALDAGSGITFFPWFLSSFGWDVRACDWDKYFFYAFREINDRWDSKVVFTANDITNLPYDSNSIDVVYCISVLEHMASQYQALHEMRRVLKPGGQFLVTFDINLDGDGKVEEGIVDCLREMFEGEFPSLPDDYGDRLRPCLMNSPIKRNLSVYCAEGIKNVQS